MKIRTVLQPIAAYEMTTEIINVAFPKAGTQFEILWCAFD